MHSFLCGRDEIPDMVKVFYDVSVWASFCLSGMRDFGFSAAYSVKIDESLRRHFQRPQHWNSVAAAVNHPHLCFSRFRRRFFSSSFLGFGFYFLSLVFFFLFYCRTFRSQIMSLLSVVKFSEAASLLPAKVRRPALSLLQQRLFSEPGQSGARAKRAIQLAA